MRVEGVEWLEDEGRPFVRFLLDGEEAFIQHEQKLPQAGAVLLHPLDRWRHLEAHIPADDATGRAEMHFNSATDEPSVVKLWWDMQEALHGGEWEVGPRPISKAVYYINPGATLDIIPTYQLSAQRLQNLISNAFKQIGESLTVEAIQNMLDEYKAQPLDSRHPLDVWVLVLQNYLDWIAMPAIGSDLAGVFRSIYQESVPVVLQRFMQAAYVDESTHQLRIPDLRMEPDVEFLAKHADEVLENIDEGTVYYFAKIMSERPGVSAELLLRVLQQELFSTNERNTNTAFSRVTNINNVELSWVRERCALDLLFGLGASGKLWHVPHEPHGPHCLANYRKGIVPLEALYRTELNNPTLYPPASASCDCYLLPPPQDLPLIAAKLFVRKSRTTDYATVWIDVPEEVAEELNISDAGIEVARVHGLTLQQLNDAMNNVARMTEPFDIALSGETGYVGRYDVAYVLQSPTLVGFHRKVCEMLGISSDNYKPFMVVGEVGKSPATFQLDFGDAWQVTGVRLCARYAGKDDCKFYPFSS